MLGLGTQVAIHHLNQEATSRGARMLRTALGPAIAIWLEDSAVVEVMLILTAGSGSTG